MPQRSPAGPEILISPVWESALTQTLACVQALADEAQVRQPTPPALVRESAGAVLARSHGLLLAALSGKAPREDMGSELLDGSARLLSVVARLWLTPAHSGYEDRLPILSGMLERQLSAHEHGILSGELTYAVTVEQAERSAARMRQSLSDLGAREHGGSGDLISLQIAAIELTGLMVLVSGNIATAGRADGSPEPGTPAVGRSLSSVVRDISSHAKLRGGQLAEQQDSSAHTSQGRCGSGLPNPPQGARTPRTLGTSTKHGST